MNGVLILAHGSRQKPTEETFMKIVSMAQEKVQMPIEIAYMEFSEKNIHAGLTALSNQGITHVKDVPYFLFNGTHIKEDIPNEINEFIKGNNHITVTMGETLGTDPRLADVLADRILN